ncbi:MAG: transglycosylase domain-containing protein [Bacteroidetes bacterium]|nr:transglycosylase domain-containing protein [Bacteroidota bacterium]
MQTARKTVLKLILKKGGLSILVLVVLGLLVLFFCRSLILDYAIHKTQNKLKTDYGVNLNFTSYELNGIAGVEIKGMFCSVHKNDTLLYLKNAKTSLRVLPLFIGRFGLGNMDAEDGTLNLHLLKYVKRKNKTPKHISTGKFEKIKRLASLFEDFVQFLPTDMKLKNLKLRFKDSMDNLAFTLNEFTYNGKNISGKLIAQMNETHQTWVAKGDMDKDDVTMHITIETSGDGLVDIHHLKKITHSDVAWKAFNFSINKFENTEDIVNVDGAIGGNGFYLYNPKISKDTIFVDKGNFAYNFKADENEIAFAQPSKITLNTLTANFSAAYTLVGKQFIKVKLNLPPVDAQSFLNALPAATFDKVKTMQWDGQIGYNLDFYIRRPKYDSVYINSDPQGINFKVIDYGKADLPKLNTAFVYQPFNSNRRIIVGGKNKNFIPWEDISPNLRSVVPAYEDGDFYTNNGFNEEAFGNSIVENIKTKSFKKGGSTITMQLVKNIFLSHKKTIDRKLEEALMVWLLNDQKICGKRRMLEVYLNIIEWGPNVYGIGEASRYYFKKHPSNLTMEECLFLGYIISQPRGFMYKFNSDGEIRKYSKDYMFYIKEKMRLMGQLPEGTPDSLDLNIRLTGSAKELLKSADSTKAIDSTKKIDNFWKGIFE